MKTSAIRKHEPTWYLVDAENMVLGRLSTKVAGMLRGKQKPEFVNHMDCGDHVVVINCEKIVMTGKKLEQKNYYHHTGWSGGIKSISAEKLMDTKPEKIIEFSVKGMLPKNKLQNEWMKRLHVYAGTEHPHQANLANKQVA